MQTIQENKMMKCSLKYPCCLGDTEKNYNKGKIIMCQPCQKICTACKKGAKSDISEKCIWCHELYKESQIDLKKIHKACKIKHLKEGCKNTDSTHRCRMWETPKYLKNYE